MTSKFKEQLDKFTNQELPELESLASYIRVKRYEEISVLVYKVWADNDLKYSTKDKTKALKYFQILVEGELVNNTNYLDSVCDSLYIEVDTVFKEPKEYPQVEELLNNLNN